MSNDTLVYSYVRSDVPANRYRSCPEGGTGVICMRIARPPKASDGPEFKYDVTFSFCSPTDNFNKVTGRRAMDGRHKGNAYTVKFKSGARLNTKQTVARALKSMRKMDKAPQWAKRSAVRYGKVPTSSGETIDGFITDNLV